MINPEFVPDYNPEVGKIATALAEAGASVPVKEKLKDAYIIKGNPEVMGKDIGKYDEFYNAVANVLQQKGLSVGFDAGLPHTLPPGGKYWIGHSRGIGRLRFAPEGVKTLRLDDFEPEETRLANEAAAAAIMKELGVSSFADVPVEKRRAPGPEHYTLNDEAIAALQALVDDSTKQAAEDFIPDYKPEDIQDSYNAIYGHYGPRLASMDKWPDEWINKDVDSMGWLQWYEQYKAGRRTEDDDRQIKRWKSFKARHGSQFKKNPTPRRAFALRNWAIDPLKLIDDEEVRGQLAKAMETYKQTAWDKYNKSNE